MSKHSWAPPVFEIPWARPSLGPQERTCLLDAFDSMWISAGPYLQRFEHEFPQKIASPYGLAVSSGTAALQLAILAAGIGADDEVIIPGFAFATVANVVTNSGATPVYADIDAATWCIDVAGIERHVTSRTKAIIVVHMFGNMCAMDEIMELARRFKLVVIEDAAEAALSRLSGRYAGTIGDAGCFSFQATKTLTMGEGGFVCSPHAQWVEEMRCMRDHGMNKTKRYWHDKPGFNFRLTNLQAAFGCAQLHRADEIAARRRAMYAAYGKHLAGLGGIVSQALTPGVDPVMWAIAVRIDAQVCRRSRDQIVEFLAARGIETRPGFYPFSQMPMYKAPTLKQVSLIAPEVLLLPSFTDLTDGEIVRVCDQLQKAVE